MKKADNILNKLLNFIANKNADDDGNAIEAYRKYVLVILFFCVGIVFLMVMGIIAFVQDNAILGAADFFIVVVLSVFVFLMRKRRNHNVYCNILVAIAGAFFLYLFILGGVDQSAHVWCYSFPVMASFILGHKKGLIYSAALALLLILSQVLADQFGLPYITAYNKNFLIRFFAVYSIITFVSDIAEWARALTYQKMVSFRDDMKKTIVKLEEARARLSELTNIDPLTKIYNKRFLNESTKLFIKSVDSKYIASTFFDIDDFKKYNDHYGHIKGDEVLVDVVKAIRQTIDGYDGIFVRFGGEELVFLLKTDDANMAENIAKKIIGFFNSIKIENKQSKLGYITLSIGISCQLKSSFNKWENIVMKSDEAMYEAKKKGKNTYCVNQACI